MSARRTSRRASDETAVGRTIELTVVARQAGVQVSLARRYLAFGLFEAAKDTGYFPPESCLSLSCSTGSNSSRLLAGGELTGAVERRAGGDTGQVVVEEDARDELLT